MAARDYATTPAGNTTIAGVNAAEGCSPAGLNNIDRDLAASIRGLADEIDALDLSVYAPKAGAVFSGTQPIYTGRGAYLHHANSANASGKITIQSDAAALPTTSNGDIVLTY